MVYAEGTTTPVEKSQRAAGMTEPTKLPDDVLSLLRTVANSADGCSCCEVETHHELAEELVEKYDPPSRRIAELERENSQLRAELRSLRNRHDELIAMRDQAVEAQRNQQAQMLAARKLLKEERRKSRSLQAKVSNLEKGSA